MLHTLIDFSTRCGLSLSSGQARQLFAYAQCVWQKKDFLNLTSAASLQEIVERHLCDGLVAAAHIYRICGQQPSLRLADAGAGCGYIGVTLAVALPQAHVTLLESLEKRCKFMNWALLTAGITNATVKKVRLGQAEACSFDVLTERAMGQLPDIFAMCLSNLRPGGLFVAFQGARPQPVAGKSPWQQVAYSLPCDNHPRYLVLFKKDDE